MTAPRPLVLFVLILLVAAAGAPAAHAAPASSVQPHTLAKLDLKKIDWKGAIPKVRFKASGKLSRNTARVSLKATVTVAGKTFSVPVFSMGIKKKGKSIKVKRKVGKLSVSLTVSWAGTRTITIKGTARYLKIKVPVGKIKISV